MGRGHSGSTVLDALLGNCADVESVGELAAEGVSSTVLAGVKEVCARIRRVFLQHELRSYRVLEQSLGQEH